MSRKQIESVEGALPGVSDESVGLVRRSPQGQKDFENGCSSASPSCFSALECGQSQADSHPSAVSAATTQCATPHSEEEAEPGCVLEKSSRLMTPFDLSTFSGTAQQTSASSAQAAPASSDTYSTSAVVVMERKLDGLRQVLQHSQQKQQELRNRTATWGSSEQDKERMSLFENSMDRMKCLVENAEWERKEKNRIQAEFQLLKDRMQAMETDNKQAKQELLEARMSKHRLQKRIAASKIEAKRAKEEILSIMSEFQACSSSESSLSSSFTFTVETEGVSSIPEVASPA